MVMDVNGRSLLTLGRALVRPPRGRRTVYLLVGREVLHTYAWGGLRSPSLP